MAKLVIARFNEANICIQDPWCIITNFHTENKKLLLVETSFQKFLVSNGKLPAVKRRLIFLFFVLFYFSVINGKPRNRAGGLKEKKYSETLKFTLGNNRRF